MLSNAGAYLEINNGEGDTKKVEICAYNWSLKFIFYVFDSDIIPLYIHDQFSVWLLSCF